jgi:hypothetical protein
MRWATRRRVRRAPASDPSGEAVDAPEPSGDPTGLPRFAADPGSS